jgi:hypothetical protein
MTALTADRSTPYRATEDFSFPVAASKTCYAGSLIVLDSSGNAEPGTTATGKIAVGRCEEQADNASGSAADINVKVRAGTFRWVNSDTITKAHIGDYAYVVDDQTVAKAASGKSIAGTIVDVDAAGVWVHTAPPFVTSTGLLAANNLSDLGTLATAITNLGLQDGSTDLDIDDLTVDKITATELSILGGGRALSDSAQAGVRKVAVVTVSATEIRTLAASPKTLVSGPGATKALIFRGAYLQYRGGSNAFDSVGAGEDLAIRYTNGSGALVSAAVDTTTDVNLGVTTDEETYIPALATVVNPVPNGALVLDNVGGGELAAADDDANGDGVITVTIEYDEMTLIA